MLNEISKIRQFINSPRKQSLLLVNKYHWNQLCSSLDIIEDTEEAIEEYINLSDVNRIGLTYLYVFGILQVLFVQQDAVKNMIEALEMDTTFNDDLLDIREIRNNSIGHPTKRGRGKSTKYNFIARPNLSLQKLTLMSVSPGLNNSTEFLHYDLHNTIRKQRKSLLQILMEINKKLGQEEMEHHEKFKDTKLADCFHPTLGYHFQKVNEVRWGNRNLKVSEIDFQMIEKTLQNFKDKLDERGILEAYDSITMVFDELLYPMKKLRDFFDQSISLDIENTTIYCHYIKNQFNELIEMANELDEKYSNNKENV